MKRITGSLQTKYGKYYAVLNLYSSDGKRRQKWVSTDLPERGSKKAARAFLDELLAVYNKRQRMTLKAISKMKHPEEFLKEQSRILALPLCDYIDEWIKHRAPSLQATTVDGYRSMCHGHLQKYIEPLDMTVYDLTGEDLNGFYSHLAKRGLKGSSIQRYHGLIHGAYAFLVKHQYIDSNPCDFADRPRAEHYRGDFYSPEELGELLKAAENSPIRIPIMLASYYALRRSEVLGVRWSNIDLKNKIIKIAHKVVEQKIGGKISVVGYDRMKTESSNRVLPLIPEVEAALLRLREHQNEQRRLCRSEYNHEYDDYVCVDEIGQLMRPNFVTTQFSKLLEAHGLRHIRFHDLRHSCASLLLANGVPMKAIQEWLGHSNYRTTVNTPKGHTPPIAAIFDIALKVQRQI